MPVHFVLLSGASGSGKSEVAAYLHRCLGFHLFAAGDVVRDHIVGVSRYPELIPFDTPYRLLLLLMARFPRILRWFVYRKPTPRPARRWLQFFGHDAGRAIEAERWLSALSARINNDLRANAPPPIPTPFIRVCLSDWRYPNEAEIKILSAQPELVTRLHIHRPSVTRLRHASEEQPTGADIVLVNSGGGDQLRRSVASVAASLREAETRWKSSRR
jgi:hypothetical protein